MAGSGGMLGESFYKNYKDEYELKCTDIDINEEWLSYLDFRDYDAYWKDVAEFNPNWLFHLGAYTDLEYCELNKEDTYVTNTESVKYAVKIANNLNLTTCGRLYFIESLKFSVSFFQIYQRMIRRHLEFN